MSAVWRARELRVPEDSAGLEILVRPGACRAAADGAMVAGAVCGLAGSLRGVDGCAHGPVAGCGLK